MRNVPIKIAIWHNLALYTILRHIQFEAFALHIDHLGDRQESLSVEWQCGSVVNRGVITTKHPENRPDLERICRLQYIHKEWNTTIFRSPI